LRDVGKALGLTEDLIKMLSGQVWGWSKETYWRARISQRRATWIPRAVGEIQARGRA
jgi:hypothetical protein